MVEWSNMKKLYTLLLTVLCFLLSIVFVSAHNSSYITDWYIKDFEIEIRVNKDSSLLITERITADCGNLPEKHGIFRVLPTQTETEEGVFKTPIKLISITDFDSNSYKYQTIRDSSSKTITWKIGDKNVTVQGENDYKIVYKVKNAVRFQNKDFDELYWNLIGSFWELSIDQFSARIVFPEEIDQQNTIIDYYTGYFGSKSKDLAIYQWIDSNVLFFSSIARLNPQQSITVSASFPKGIFASYQMSFFEKYSDYFYYLFFLIPLIVFIYCFVIWKKHGKDPKMRRPVPPEFGIPDKITPIQMGMIISSGRWNNKLVTATIIDLAVRKFLVIEEIEEKKLFFKAKEYILKKTDGFNTDELTEPERIMMEKIFKDANTVILSSLRNSFYRQIIDIKKAAFNDLVNNNWMVRRAKFFTSFFSTFGIIICILSYFLLYYVHILLFFSVLLSGTILTIFSRIMPKRTPEGTELLFRINGFRIYMKHAEKYRQQFYEQENIFDKFLPYAIVFGMAGLWIKKMEKMYGKEYFATYHPVWFAGKNVGSFDANNFVSQLNSITSSISSSMSSPSGAAGAGGAGGGGGGGGGGGW